MATPETPRRIASLVAVEPEPDTLYAAFAVLQDVREGRTRKQEVFLDLELGDCTGVVKGKIWADAGAEIQNAARDLARGTVVKVLFHADVYRGSVQLRIHKIRAASEEDEGYDAAELFGEGYEHVRNILCANMIFDIETVPAADRRELPQTVAESLARHTERMNSDEAKVMGLSPFFGKIVSLAVGDADDDSSIMVFVVPPDGREIEDAPDWMRPVSEVELLHAWWALAAAAETVISYNGRGFDVPFLVARSLIHRIPARVDLLSHRYSLRPHLDLYRALTHGERALGPSSLDVVCWGLGIESPKGMMDGSMVAPAYERGEIEKIASYNAQDVRATRAVYRELRDHVLRFRDDW
jgi:hypothetical protein